jgi:hypothetical protein
MSRLPVGSSASRASGVCQGRAQMATAAARRRIAWPGDGQALAQAHPHAAMRRPHPSVGTSTCRRSSAGSPRSRARRTQAAGDVLIDEAHGGAAQRRALVVRELARRRALMMTSPSRLVLAAGRRCAAGGLAGARGPTSATISPAHSEIGARDHFQKAISGLRKRCCTFFSSSALLLIAQGLHRIEARARARRDRARRAESGSAPCRR